MSHEKSILEIFNETIERDAAEVASRDKEMSASAKEQEKILEHVRADLTKERAIWANLRKEYDGLETAIEVKVRVDLKQMEITEAEVQAGKVTATEYLKTHLSEKDLRFKVRTEVEEKLGAVTELLRKKKTRIYELEDAEATAVRNLAFSAHYAPNLRAEKMKQEAEYFGRVLNPLAEALMAARNAEEKTKINLRLAQGKRGVDNLIWDDLSFAQIADLRFDPRIAESMIFQIEEFLSGADPEARFRGRYITIIGEAGGNHFIAFDDLGGPRIVGPKITTGDLK